MKAERLLKHYERIAEAPGAVERLRRFILDLAMRGKLVPQDPKDEPASELLKRITAEKVRLVKAGETRKPALLAAIAESETPYALPSTWIWARVGDVFDYDAGIKREPKELARDRWLLELEDIKKDTSAVLERLRVSDRDPLSTKSEFEVSDILYGKLRPYLNKVIVADEPGYSTTEIVAIRPFLKLCPGYCALAFRRPDFVAYVDHLGRGTKMPRLRTPDAIVAVFPLPPLAEQRRIVAKVDELMALCDRLDMARAERENRRDRLAAASLARLNAPDPDPAIFSDHARFVLDTIPTLATRPDQIKQLRQTILNLAVRGKLVPQDASDEPVTLMIGRLSKLSPRAISTTTGHVRHDGGEQFELPTGWSWLNGDQVAEFVDPQPSHRTPPHHKGGVPYVGYADIGPDGRIDFENARKVSASVLLEHKQRYVLRRGDFVIGKIGTIGQPHFLCEPFDYTLSANLILVQPNTSVIVPAYLVIFFQSPIGVTRLRKQSTDSTHAVFGIKKARKFGVPTPPRTEQLRIVAKVDELMALCDRLEASLTTGDDTRLRLLDALLAEALARPGGIIPAETPRVAAHA